MSMFFEDGLMDRTSRGGEWQRVFIRLANVALRLALGRNPYRWEEEEGCFELRPSFKNEEIKRKYGLKDLPAYLTAEQVATFVREHTWLRQHDLDFEDLLDKWLDAADDVEEKIGDDLEYHGPLSMPEDYNSLEAYKKCYDAGLIAQPFVDLDND